MAGQWHKDWADAEDAKEEREERKRVRKEEKEALSPPSAPPARSEANIVLYATPTGKALEVRDYQLEPAEPPTPEVLIEAANDLTDLRPGFIEPTDAGDHLRRSTLQHQQLAVPIRRRWSISNVRSALGGDPLDAVGQLAK